MNKTCRHFVAIFAVVLILCSACDKQVQTSVDNQVVKAKRKANDNQTYIYTIQGTSHESPLKGKKVVKVPGVITGITVQKGVKTQKWYQSGFYMQDKDGDGDPVTSDGIYVSFAHSFTQHFAVGDEVLVSGMVEEYVYQPKNEVSTDLSVTRIAVSNAADISITASGRPLPEPVELAASNLQNKVFESDLNTLNPNEEAIDFFESLEGMRVKVTKPKIIAGPYKGTYYIAPFDAKGFTSHGGLIYNSYDSTARICMFPRRCFSDNDKAGVPIPAASIGDSFTDDIVGVIGYSFSHYLLETTQKLPQVLRSHSKNEQSPIQFSAEKLNIATYNLENFSIANTKNSHSSKKTAQKRAEVFADHFINQLKAPDILCLLEIQDDDGEKDSNVVSADKTLNLLMNKMKELDPTKPYAACYIAPEWNKDGGMRYANIRPVYLYRSDRLELVDDSDKNVHNSTYTTKVEAAARGVFLIQNPARIGVEGESFKRTRKSLVAHFRFKKGKGLDKDFFIINNHFYSKQTDDKIWGKDQPAVRRSDKKRHMQAMEVVNVINDIKRLRPDAAIISAGDYNDFWFSDTIALFKNAGMINTMEKVPENERYTYVYEGHSQALDSILVTDNVMVDNVTILHVNAEQDPAIRVSDHDPIFVQVSW